MMKKRERSVKIDVLMEGSAGDLVFQPIKASKSDLRALVRASTNPVIRENVKKRAEERKVKL